MMELTDIILAEADNRHHIYLYAYRNGAWRCCGHSANLLHRLYPNIFYSEKAIPGWLYTFPVAIIDSMSLEHMMENLPPKERTVEKIVIEIPDIWLLTSY